MKKVQILFFVFAIGLLQSCTDFLNIRPENEIVLEDYWKSESQATAVLASCYRSLILDATVERMFVWGEVRSDNVVAGAYLYTDLYKILDVSITPTNSYANWAVFYSTINYCNTFLHYAPSVVERDANFTPTKLHALEAEAYTIRALCYFYLVRAFRDVPLVTEASISDDQNYYVAKSKESVVLGQIISDLLYAQKYAKTDYGTGLYNKGRVTLNTVNALLADVYLWDQQFDKCVTACDAVLADKSFKLVDGEKVITDVFGTGNSTESIFELQFDKDVQDSYAINYLLGNQVTAPHLSFPHFLTRKGEYSPFVYKGVPVTESTEDIREYTSYGTLVNGAGYLIYKYAMGKMTKSSDGTTYLPTFRTASSPANWILYRLSDVILMKAEALVQLNRNKGEDLKTALELVNRTYLRSNPNADSLLISSYQDQANMEKLVLRERQREFLFEGKRWFDLMRLARRRNDPTSILAYVSPKLSGDAMSKNKMSVMDALYFPIQKAQLDINSLLEQNPFYTDENLSN